MFSTAQQQIVDSYVPTMISHGYKYYIAYTHYNSGYQNTDPDLYFIFSSEEITANSGYSYEVPQGSIMVRVRSGNYSQYNYSDRFVTIDYSGTLNIDVFEHIYSNVTYTGTVVMPDIMKEGSQNNAIYSQTGNILLCAFLLVFCFFKMWQIHK